jgi:cathepsin A (carboxypeptidase C)
VKFINSVVTLSLSLNMLNPVKIILLFALITALSCRSDSKIFFNEDMESGIMWISTYNDMFYWLFRSRNNSSTAPLVLWLTGELGCASELAIFYENGPFTINDDLSLKRNKFSWNENSNMLYVDQPVGVGFSRALNPTQYAWNEKMISEYLYNFLSMFMTKYPEFKGRPLYITGESYAGHYIPAIANYIIQNPSSDFNLRGIAIGNGIIPHYK